MPGGINVPLDVIASWPTPNYKDPVTQPRYVLVFSSVIGPISIVLLGARLWVRIRMQHNAGWDDWLMLAAALPILALTVMFPLVTEVYRFNRHAWDVEYKYFPIQRKLVMAIYILFSVASGLIKLSILLFYRRLSSRTVSPAFRWSMRITIFAIGAYSIIFMIIPIFMCRPISAFWDQVNFTKIAHGYKYTCINEGMDVVAHGTISTLQDLVVASLPMLLCWNLQMPRRQKIALYVIFALGYMSVVVGAMRTYQGYRLFFTTYDVTWVASDIWLWSLLELHIGSMCANAPALRIFFDRVLEVDRMASWKRSRSQSYLGGSVKQNSGKSKGVAGSGPAGRRGYEKPFQSSRRDSTRCGSISLPLSAITQGIDKPDEGDNMTNTFVLEYMDTVIRHDSSAHDSGMSAMPTKKVPLDDSLQAIRPYQTPAFIGKKGGRPPPLSQVRTSWNIDGRRYVWKPWERYAPAKATEHPQWV